MYRCEKCGEKWSTNCCPICSCPTKHSEFEAGMPLNLSWDYHDSIIADIVYSSDDSMTLIVNLDGCWNESVNNPVQLIFHGVRNVGQVKEALCRATESNRDKGYMDEIYAIYRGTPRGFVIHLLKSGYLYVDADEYSEA